MDFLQLEQKHRRHRELLGESVMIFLPRAPQSEVEKGSYFGANKITQNDGVNGKFKDLTKWSCLVFQP